MQSQTIIEVLDRLIGPTDAVGETNADHIIEYNLKNLIEVVNWCLDGISQSAYTRHSFEKSVRDIGERAFGALCDWCEWLDERIGED